jgi:hypothetical protein
MIIDILGPDLLRSSRPIAVVKLVKLLASPGRRAGDPLALSRKGSTLATKVQRYREAIIIALVYGARMSNSTPIQLGVEHAVWI